jgi:hypothetical protein
MFEDSKTDLFVNRVDNATNLRGALTAGMGGFYLLGTNAVPVVAVLSTIATDDHEYCLRTTRGALKKSPTFNWNQISEATITAASARVEQLSYLGYNGVAGSMDVATNTYYGLKVILDHTFGMLNNSPLIKTIPYKSGVTNNQYDMAMNIAEVFNTQFNRESLRSVVAEAICNDPVDATQLVDHDVTVVNGSNVVNVATNLTYQATAHTFVVGDFLRIGSATKVAGAGTALTSAVYRVTAIAGLVVTLDRPVFVRSEAYHQATADVEVIESAAGIAANWGIRFDGVSVADADFNPITDTPFVSSFTLEAGDFTTATVTYTTIPFIGRGTYQLVSAMEAYAQFQNKTREISAMPPTLRNFEAVAGETYAIHSFVVTKHQYTNVGSGQAPISKHRIIIASLTGIGDIAEYTTVLAAATGSVA